MDIYEETKFETRIRNFKFLLESNVDSKIGDLILSSPSEMKHRINCQLTITKVGNEGIHKYLVQSFLRSLRLPERHRWVKNLEFGPYFFLKYTFLPLF